VAWLTLAAAIKKIDELERALAELRRRLAEARHG
jgi:hypothetical protein